MFKKLCLPLVAVAVFQFAVAPSAHAAMLDNNLYKSLLKKIYADSDEGDGGDIYHIIRNALNANPDQGVELVDKLIATLEDNRDQLAFDVSEDDLKRIESELKHFLKKRAILEFVLSRHHGNVAPPESGVVNN